jgi:hypothetical protein
MLDWIRILSAFGVTEWQDIPHLGTLIKNKDDYNLVMNHMREVQGLLQELGIERKDLQICYEPVQIVQRRQSQISERIEGKDELGRIIVQLQDGTRYIKSVTTPEEQDSDNYW